MAVLVAMMLLLSSLDLCWQVDSSGYRPATVHPTNLEPLVAGISMKDLNSLTNRALTCSSSRRGEVTPLPMRVIIVSIEGHRKLGPNSFKPLYCYRANTEWVQSDDCKFETKIEVTSMPAISYNHSIVLQCVYESRIYSTEVVVQENWVRQVTNYWPLKTRIRVYHPLALITCATTNKLQLSWSDTDTKTSHQSEFVMPPVANATMCKPVKTSQLFHMKCMSTNMSLYEVVFKVSNCFQVDIRVMDSGTRVSSNYEAGEVVTCALTPMVDHNEHFTHNLMPVVAFLKETDVIGTPQVFLEIPPNFKGCTSCYVTCGFQYKQQTHLFMDIKKKVTIFTNRRTFLELINSLYDGRVFNINFDDQFRCLKQRYGVDCATVISISTVLPSPYSSMQSIKGVVRWISEPDHWVSINKSSYMKYKNTHWFVHCQLKGGEMTSPMKISVFQKSEIEVNLVYPLKEDQANTLEGFIYKFTAHNMAYLKLTCIDGCNSVIIKNFPSQKLSYAIITAVFVTQRINLRCLGFRSSIDTIPLQTDKTLYATPSIIQRPPKFIPTNFGVSCTREYRSKDDQTMVQVKYDSKLILTHLGTSQILSTDIENNVSSVAIPDTIQNGTSVESCCVDSVNDNGQLDCGPYGRRAMNVIKIKKTAYSSSLAEDGSSRLDQGTILSCMVCGEILTKNRILKCFNRNTMILQIFKPQQPPTRFDEQGFVQIPYVSDLEQKSISEWVYQLTCQFGSLNISSRTFRVKFCDEVRILPEKKEIFRVNESIECESSGYGCPLYTFFKITVFTNNVLTYQTEEAFGVNFDSRFVGSNVVTCTSTRPPNNVAQRRIFVESAPIRLEILNEKKMMLVGDVATCEGFGYPKPWKEWWFVSGREALKTSNNKLMILPNTHSSDYVYDCVVENFHGNLTKRFAFSVFNKYRRYLKNAKHEGDIWFCVYLVLVFVLYVILFGLCNYFVFGTRFRQRPPLV